MEAEIPQAPQVPGAAPPLQYGQLTNPSPGRRDRMDSGQPRDHQSLEAAGLDAPTIARLATLRQRVATGERSELTQAHKYLLFLRYLVDSHRFDAEGAT